MPTAMSTLALLACATVTFADVYMHNPRGSNNRLNEQSANRNNGNRVFDSQNNNRGGYNKGDVDDTAAGGNQGKQYDMVYYQSDPADTGTGLDQTSPGNGQTVLSIEWTNQHGCGGNEHGDPHKLNCQIVLQYMCVDSNAKANTGPDKNNQQVAAGGPVDGFRDNCNFECMIPNVQNPECLEKTPDNKPACGLSEIDDAELCVQRGYKWVPAQINDQYNCPHSCTGASDQHSKAECEGAGGTWTPSYGGGNRLRFRDGTTTNRQDFTNLNNANENQAQRANRKRGNVQADRVLHESWEWYDECYRRERNRGLFTADQKLRNNNLGYSSAVYTRQNPNNNRRGYECPEERDHYPYWHPSPWRDIAVLTDRLDQCTFYKQESQNVKSKHLCRNTNECPNCVRYNNEADCNNNKGKWAEVGPWGIPAPVCEQAPWSRVNHLGNGRYGQANTFNWTIPSFSKADGGRRTQFEQRCVTRLRYNISTDDYDAWKVNNTFNQNNGQGIKSPVQQNPAVDIGVTSAALRLAINTAQFGRTFQDRSHVLTFAPRPVTNSDENSQECSFQQRTTTDPTATCQEGTPIFEGRRIHNLNVRGKRCNIVQCFPSVEYDFAPNHLHIGQDDLVHIQWTGSNTHNNGNPAGDGQAGDAGEGRRGTDRHNFVELRSREGSDFGGSFPAPWSENTLFGQMKNVYAPKSKYTCDHGCGETPKALPTCTDKTTEVEKKKCFESLKRSWAVRMATAGFYNGFDLDEVIKGEGNGYQQAVRPAGIGMLASTGEVNDLLNNAPASFPGGVFQFSRGTYNYMNTRNHNFSNRDQKGHLVVA